MHLNESSFLCNTPDIESWTKWLPFGDTMFSNIFLTQKFFYCDSSLTEMCDNSVHQYIMCHLGPLLLTWIDFNPRMD